MAIAFSCSCGAEFEVPDHLAGKRTRCPACGTGLVVPSAPEEEPVTDVEVDDDAVPYRLADDSRPYDYAQPEKVNDAQPSEDEEVEFVDEEVEFVDDPEHETEPDIDGEPKFFVAAHATGSSLRHPKTIRIYQCGQELLVMNAGPFGWGSIDSLMNRPSVRDEFARRRGSGLGGGVLGSDADEVTRKKLSQRAAVLDRMTLSELRTECESDKSNFKVTAENTSKARIEPPRPGMFEESGADDLVVGRLNFTHSTAGKWEVVLLSRADAKMAMGALRRVLGHDNVHVSLKFKS